MFGPCLITGGNRGRGGKDSLILSLKKYQTSSYLIPSFIHINFIQEKTVNRLLQYITLLLYIKYLCTTIGI